MQDRFPWWLSNKESTSNAGDACSILGAARPLGEGNGKPTPIDLAGKSCGQRDLVGYSTWGYKRVRHYLATKQQKQYARQLQINSECLLSLSIRKLLDLMCYIFKFCHYILKVTVKYFLKYFNQSEKKIYLSKLILL